MVRPAGPRKSKITLSLSTRARTILEEVAVDRRRTLSDVVEALLIEADDGREEYFRRQLAFQSFVAAAVSIATASKVLGPQATSEVQERASVTARRLYGRAPARPFEVEDGEGGDQDDARVRALFLAFGAG